MPLEVIINYDHTGLLPLHPVSVCCSFTSSLQIELTIGLLVSFRAAATSIGFFTTTVSAIHLATTSVIFYKEIEQVNINYTHLACCTCTTRIIVYHHYGIWISLAKSIKIYLLRILITLSMYMYI